MYARPDPIAQAPATSRRAPLWHRAIAFLLKAALPVALLFGAAEIARDIAGRAPVAARIPPAQAARLVAAAPAGVAEFGPQLRAWGTVRAARRLVLRPEISGRIARLNPALTPGAIVLAGEVLAKLDDREARLEIAEAEAEIARIDAQIRLEMGQQRRAERDLARNPIRGGITEEQRALILRAPQLAELEATRAAALVRRDTARLRADKSVLTAPFDALVEAEELAEGTVVSAGAEIARLVAADPFRVVLAVPPAALARIEAAPEAELRLFQPGVWPEGVFRTGRIARIGGAVSETGRMAEVVVEIDDPLARKPETAGPRLLLGSLLEAEIRLPAIAGGVAVDRTWLRPDDTIWVVVDGRLEIRPVTVAWRGADRAIVTAGLAPGEMVVTSRIETVADGMAVRLAPSREEADR
ncbi:MAG: efflux RND transporter periplasmic adaptor subunit [Pikeienuella sp.]